MHANRRLVLGCNHEYFPLFSIPPNLNLFMPLVDKNKRKVILINSENRRLEINRNWLISFHRTKRNRFVADLSLKYTSPTAH